jgi:hypothetical protein
MNNFERSYNNAMSNKMRFLQSLNFFLRQGLGTRHAISEKTNKAITKN